MVKHNDDVLVALYHKYEVHEPWVSGSCLMLCPKLSYTYLSFYSCGRKIGVSGPREVPIWP